MFVFITKYRSLIRPSVLLGSNCMVVAAVFCLLFSLSNVSYAQESSCPPERVRSKKLESKLLQNLILGVTFTPQNRPHPEDDPNPRPGWKPDLYDYKESLQSTYIRSLQSRHFPETLYFMFIAEPYKSDKPGVINVDRHSAWCLIRAGDSVYLRRGRITHITSVFMKNIQNGEIFFLDPWPRRFLIRPSKIDKTIIPGKEILVIKKKYFIRSLVGFVTLDTPDLLDYYFKIKPNEKNNPIPYLSFGEEVIYFGDDRFVDTATSYFRRAQNVAKRANNQAMIERTANRLYLSLLLGYYKSLKSGRSRTAVLIEGELENLWKEYGNEEILKGNRAIDFYRLGLRAGEVNKLESAIYFFGRAIHLKEDYQGAYLYRAVAKSKLRDSNGVITDATAAIRFNDDGFSKLKKRVQGRHAYDKFGQGADNAMETKLREFRALALQLRGTALNSMRRHQEALKDGVGLIALRPKSVNGYVIAGFAELLIGEVRAAKDRFEKARTLESNPQLKYVIEDTLKKINSDPRISGKK